MHRHHRSHSRYSGESREVQGREHTSSSMHRDISRSSADNYRLSHPPTSSRHQSTRPQIDDHTQESSPAAQDVYQQQPSSTEQYYTVPRPWEAVNPTAQRVTQNEALESAFHLLGNHSPNLSHRRVPSTQHASHMSNPQSSHHRSSSGGNPLTLSSLQQFNESQASTSNMVMWRGESQRHCAWNGVGYVRTQSDYDWSRSNGYQ